MKARLHLLARTLGLRLVRTVSTLQRLSRLAAPDHRLGKHPGGAALWLALVLGCAAPFSVWPAVQADWERVFNGTSPQIYAQTRAEGTNAYAIKVDANGNVYVGTTTQYGLLLNDADMLLLKYDCHGTLLWSKTFDNAAAHRNDYLSSLDLDAAGNVVVTGFSEVAGGRQWVTLKYSPAGVILWGPNLYGTASSLTVPRAIAVDGFGDVVVSGIDFVAGVARISMAKYCGQDGTQLGFAAANTVPGPADMVHPQAQSGGTPMALDKNGNAIVVGWMNQAYPAVQCLTVKFKCQSASACTLGGSYAFEALLHAGSGQQLGYAVALNQNTTPQRIYVLGYDRLNTQWTVVSYKNRPVLPVILNTVWNGTGVVNYSHPGSTNDEPSAIAVAADGKVVATGSALVAGRQEFLTVKWDEAGAIPGFWPPILTSPTFASTYDNLRASALKVDAAGNAYVTGTGQNAFGDRDFLTIRYGLAPLATAPEDWWITRDYPSAGSGTYHDKGVAMTLDAGGHVYVTGPSSQIAGAPPMLADTVKYCQGQPNNDTCANAQTVASGTVAFSTCFATDSSATACVGANLKDVWFRWTASCNGTVEMDTFGSCYDTVLAVYDAGTGGTCGTLGAALACNNNATAGRPFSPPSAQSYATFTAIAGHVYYIQIGGAGGATGDGRLTIFGPNPTLPTCPSTGTWGAWRKFRLTGTGTGVNWRWSISAPCCVNIQGTATGPAAGSSATALAAAFATSINTVCPGMAASSGDKLRVRARCSGSFDFRVGQVGTAFNALCLVPNISTAGLTTYSYQVAPGICLFNPEITEEPAPPADCNGNGVPDENDIDLGISLDVNQNGIPDECETPVLQTITNSVVNGYNFIAVQLVSSNSLLDTVLPGALDGDQVFLWNAAAQDYTLGDVFLGGFGWIDASSGNPSTTTLSPGEGAFYSSSAARTWTFSGTAIVPTLPIFTQPGFTVMASRQTPGPGTYENIVGLPPEAGSQFIRFDRPTQDYVTNTFNGIAWSGGAPVANPGEAVFIGLVPPPPTSYTINLQNGLSLIANQLDHGSNTADVVIPNPTGELDGCLILKWNCGGSFNVAMFDSTQPTGFSDMTGSIPIPAPTLNLGEAFFFNNQSGSPLNLVFTGTPHVPVLPATLPCGYGQPNYLSRQTNGAGTYQNIVGVEPGVGAQFNRWNVATQNFITNTFNGVTWSGGVPFANVGEGVVIYPVAPPASTTYAGLNHGPLGNASLATISNRLIVSNLGTQGQDGVTIAIPNSGGLNLHWMPPDLALEGHRLAVTTRGMVNGATNQPLSVATAIRVGDVVQLAASFPAIPLAEGTIELFLGGRLVAVCGSGSNPVVQALPTEGGGPRVPCDHHIYIHWESNPIWVETIWSYQDIIYAGTGGACDPCPIMVNDAPPVLADAIHFISGSASNAIQGVESVEITCQGPSFLQIDAEALQAFRMPNAALGQAQLQAQNLGRGITWSNLETQGSDGLVIHVDQPPGFGMGVNATSLWGHVGTSLQNASSGQSGAGAEQTLGVAVVHGTSTGLALNVTFAALGATSQVVKFYDLSNNLIRAEEMLDNGTVFIGGPGPGFFNCLSNATPQLSGGWVMSAASGRGQVWQSTWDGACNPILAWTASNPSLAVAAHGISVEPRPGPTNVIALNSVTLSASNLSEFTVVWEGEEPPYVVEATPHLSMQRSNETLHLAFEGTLQSANNPAGPWTNLGTNGSLLLQTTGAMQFLRAASDVVPWGGPRGPNPVWGVTEGSRITSIDPATGRPTGPGQFPGYMMLYHGNQIVSIPTGVAKHPTLEHHFIVSAIGHFGCDLNTGTGFFNVDERTGTAWPLGFLAGREIKDIEYNPKDGQLYGFEVAPFEVYTLVKITSLGAECVSQPYTTPPTVISIGVPSASDFGIGPYSVAFNDLGQCNIISAKSHKRAIVDHTSALLPVLPGTLSQSLPVMQNVQELAFCISMRTLMIGTIDRRPVNLTTVDDYSFYYFTPSAWVEKGDNCAEDYTAKPEDPNPIFYRKIR